jgi:hypothetical protein
MAACTADYNSRFGLQETVSLSPDSDAGPTLTDAGNNVPVSEAG